MKYPMIAMVLGLAACATDPAPLDIELDLQQAPSQLLDRDTATIETIPGSGDLLLRGVFTLPSPCFSVATSAAMGRLELVIELRAVQERQVCLDVVVRSGYEARVRNAPSGSYRVVVNHAWNNETQQVASTAVSIP